MACLYFLADGLPLGGVTTYIQSLAAALQKLGHEVGVLISEAVSDNEKENWPQDVKLKIMAPTSLDTRVSFNRKVRHYLLEQRAEVIFFNNCSYADSYLLRGTSMCGVYVVHGSSSGELIKFKKEGAFCYNIVTPAPGIARIFEVAFPQYYVSYIPHGTRVPAAMPVKEMVPFKVMYLGRLAPEKGADKLPAILAPLLKNNTGVVATITGSEAENPKIALGLRAAFREAAGRVVFAGPLRGARLTEELQKTHAILLPSRHEAFGLAAIEGAAQGAVPVISKLQGTTDSLFINKKEAFLCNPEDTIAFCEALEYLCKNTAGRQAMAVAAYQKAQHSYSVEGMATAYEELLEGPTKKILHPIKPGNWWQALYPFYRNVRFLKALKTWGRLKNQLSKQKDISPI